MNDILLQPYDYVAYVDASGDDGIKFNKGSSSCYAVATFIVKKEDIQHNEDLLLEIKRKVGLKPTDELKYTTLRKKRNFPEVLKLLKTAKGQLITWIAFKEAIDDPDIIEPQKKMLSSMCHYFPIKGIEQLGINNILIAVDVMKKVEMDTLSALIENDLITPEFGSNITYTLKFYDSKNKDFSLIQLADIFSGIIRTTAEELYKRKAYMATCNNCFRMQVLKVKKTKCPIKKALFPVTQTIYSIKPLFVKGDNGYLFTSITCFPFSYIRGMRFLDCNLYK